MLCNARLRNFVVRAGYSKGKGVLKDLDVRLGVRYPSYPKFRAIGRMMVHTGAGAGAAQEPGAAVNVVPMEIDKVEDGGYATGGWKRYLDRIFLSPIAFTVI